LANNSKKRSSLGRRARNQRISMDLSKSSTGPAGVVGHKSVI
jgi:hypothetical protein